MLGVSGLRGIVGESLTPDVATRYAAAFGAWLRERVNDPDGPSVVIGRDGRAGGADIMQAAIEGLLHTGCRVTDVGVAMTPTVGVAVDHIDAHAGMVVTASHNPQQWNGLKCLLADVRQGRADHATAAAPPADLAQQIIDRFQSGRDARAAEPGHRTQWSDAAAEHVARVERALDESNSRTGHVRFRVVVDSVNASGASAARDLLASLGADVVAINDDDSGIFPHTPEPIAANLTDLCAIVTEAGADVGFAQDPDADRLAIVDEHGRYIGEEYTLALAAHSLLSAPGDHAGAILCTNLSTSRMIDDVAAHHGARVIRTPVGEANVAHAMKTHASNLGGEGNGGVIWPSVACVRDSLSAMALVLSLMARTGRTVSQLVADINALGPNPDGYVIEKRKVDIPSRDAATPAIEAIAAHFATRPGARLDRQDGVRIDFEGAWLHVRPSNTEPIMRLIAEAPTAEGATTLLDEAARAIR
jgi:phosphomannomutase